MDSMKRNLKEIGLISLQSQNETWTYSLRSEIETEIYMCGDMGPYYAGKLNLRILGAIYARMKLEYIGPDI